MVMVVMVVVLIVVLVVKQFNDAFSCCNETDVDGDDVSLQWLGCW